MTRSALCALILLFPGLAHAQVDILEATEGATHMSALAGDGGLTVGLAPTGEVTQLLWPTPLGNPQVRYQTSASTAARTLPRFGAAETDGLFLGLWLEMDNGSELTWLRDLPWTHEQTYDGSAVVQTDTHSALGLRVITYTAATGNTLAQRAVIERDANSPVQDVWLVAFADLQPNGDDWLAFWDPTGDRVLSFVPDDIAAPGRELMMNESWTTAVWASDALPLAQSLAAGANGTHLAFGGATPSAVHIGSRDGADCVPGASWQHPVSAWTAIADSLDAAETFGAPVAACDADVALSWLVDFKDDGPIDRGAVDLFLTAGPSMVSAANRLDGSRTDGFELISTDAESDAAAFLATLSLPTGVGGADVIGVSDFAARWARSAASVMDPSTGAIAASAASQPRFNVDRPWESAWTELALELTGDFDAVSAHQRYIAEQQSIAGVTVDGTLVVPPGAWQGDRGPFDLAQVGLTTWSFWRHAQYASNEGKARTTLASSWLAMSAAADLLTTCVSDDHPAIPRAADAGLPAWYPLYEDLLMGTAPDAAAGFSAGAAGNWEALRPCASWEGGASVPGATLLATHLARLGLESAVAAADALCVDEPRVAAWEARAQELAALLLAADYDGIEWTGRGPLLTWPLPLEIEPAWRFAFATSSDPDAQIAEVAAYIDAATSAWIAQEHRRAVDAITLETDGRGDESLALLAGGRARSEGRSDRLLQSQARAVLERLVTDLSTPGTGHLGAAFVVDEQAIKGADQRVGQPYVPAASMAIAALLAYSAPDILAPAEGSTLELTCAEGEEPDLQRKAPACGDDCASSVGGRPRGASSLALLFGLLALTIRRRR